MSCFLYQLPVNDARFCSGVFGVLCGSLSRGNNFFGGSFGFVKIGENLSVMGGTKPCADLVIVDLSEAGSVLFDGKRVSRASSTGGMLKIVESEAFQREDGLSAGII